MPTKNKLTALQFETVWPGREEIRLQVEVDENHVIQSSKLTGVGGPELLQLLREIRPKLKGSLAGVEIPKGTSPAALAMRETLLKAKGEWKFPYESDEVCHCRSVPTAVIDQAICAGAHTPQKVSAQTSASTACGTCRPDVEAIIRYRLGS